MRAGAYWYSFYKQDYELLLPYFSKIYPIQDAFDGTAEPAFDVCS